MLARWLSVAGVVLAIDQLTKRIVVTRLDYLDEVPVLPFFSWVRWHNEGAAFSFLNDAGGWQRWFFSALAIGFSAYLIFELRRLRQGEWLQGLAYALILAGALGNLIDRLAYGYVVDFVLLHYSGHVFPAFNVADSSIFIGAVLWFLLLWRETCAEMAS
ncbi:MAG: signal peptidase II [Pseudomonadota bacterium]